MKRFSWIALVAGFASTIIVTILAWFGVLDNAEFDSVDWRYRHARTIAEPLSDEIALVVIDNSSLDTIGRWPWPRIQFAAALDELARANARTVALDLLLSEPDSDLRGDESLAQAMTAVRTVLGVNVSPQYSIEPEWRSAEGSKELASIIEVLSSHIDEDPVAAADQAHLTGARREIFLSRPLWFKALAAWNVIWATESGASVTTLDDLVFKLRGANRSSKFAEGVLVQELWNRAQSWRDFQDELVRRGSFAEPLGGHEHEPPVPKLAQKAVGLGVVTNEMQHNDSDGAKRRTGTAWVVPGGSCRQFGLVAAATHLGIKPSEIASSEQAIDIGGTKIALDGGVMVLDWPTSTFGEGFAKWSQAGLSGQERAVVSVGQLVNLHSDRDLQSANEALRDATRARMMEQFPALATMSSTSSVRKQSIDEFAQMLNDARMGDTLPAGAEASAEEFLKLYEESQRGATDIATRSDELKRKFNDKLVFLGWSATGALADFVPTPYDPKTPGVFIHAVVADMVLSKHARDTAPSWVQPLAILLFGGLASLCACRLGTGWSAGAMIVLVAVWLWFAGRFAFNDVHLIMPLVGPVIAPVASWATGTAAIAIVTSIDRARITRQFSARVSPQLVARLSNNPDALTVSGQERRITVIFGDLGGFTTIAEQLGGPGVVRTLNLYLGRLSDELVKRDAYVNKFLGDGFMAFWSAFGDEPRQESLAAESAVACQAVMVELAKSSEASIGDGTPKISVRLGIATGMAVVGDCGAPPKLNDYTAIGDVVNLSSRLESANKQFGTGILIDGATRQGIEEQGMNAAIKIRPLGLVVVVGQSKPIEVFEVVGADASDAWISATAKAVGLFRDRKLAESNTAWREFELAHGSSKLSAMYLDAIASGEGADDGVLRLRAK